MTPEQELEKFISRFTPEVAIQTREALAWMRARLPGAIELVYDNYNALAIAFGPTERSSDAIFSIAVFPRWVSLFFLHGATLPDPHSLLQGSGIVVRHIVLEGTHTFESPHIKKLMLIALKSSQATIDKTQPNRLIIKSISPRQRPRRPK